ncbi:MAG: DPP IV N-terminal domain-containing protein [Sphingobacteriales bacterium]|nr:DPP IV N-terminal domain-containing protein [Sphingobacteriales bacterium]
MANLFHKTITVLALGSVLILEGTTSLYAQKKELSNDIIWGKSQFSAKAISGLRSMNDGKHYSSFYTNPDTKATYILAYEYATGKVTDTILKSSELKIMIGNDVQKIQMDNYEFSGDETKILISNSSEGIYRHSSKELNYIFDRKTRRLQNLSDFGKQMFASFSPNGDKVAFVRDNNIFVRDVATREEVKVTDDGEWEHIINGWCDWVYEEEFGYAPAFQWSPDGKNIAFYKFDESAVKRFNMAMYGELYPKDYQYKYPKAGEKNSTVSIHIYNLTSAKTTGVDIGTETDQYIPKIKWTADPNKLCVMRLNRHQDKLEYLMADANSGSTKVILTETSKTYIDISDDLTFLNDQKTFITSSEKEGYNQLYLYDISGKLIRKITTGNWDLSAFYGMDATQKTIYFQAGMANPTQREIYKININGKGLKKISSATGTNTAFFSNGCNYFINYYSNANTPNFITLNDNAGKQIRVLEDNKKLNDRLAEYNLTKKEFLTVTTSEGVQLNAWMMKPSNFDPAKKYPVFMFLYGGPGSQQVLDSWGGANYMWYQMLTQKGYIVFCVDNRGTGARGAEFKKMTHLQLGKYETIDQIETAKWLGKQSYVDASRIGIQGWSYGGYMSSLCITKGADVFKMAIAVAPVTNWKYYDSIYTERYLHTPQENKSGYEDNSPINFVNKLKGNYLIIHGTADDNVHFQNSVDMIDAMVKANKKFESAYYPNKNHGILGGTTRVHLYNKMTDFIYNSL